MFAYDYIVLIMTPEYFSKENVQMLLQILAKNNIITRIVVDECHLPLQCDETFRDDYLKIYYKLSLLKSCKIVVLSATTNQFMKKYILNEISPTTYIMIKMCCYQNKILINCVIDDTTIRINLLQKYSNNLDKLKGIIIIRKLADLFNENKYKFIITTSGNLVGINTEQCNIIIFYALPLTSSNFLQDLGRVSRNKKRSYDFIYTTTNISRSYKSILNEKKTPIREIYNKLNSQECNSSSLSSLSSNKVKLCLIY
uniref:DNA 3'-5' helicase n=1 Tax=Strongyloides stercoralis TaxID=6248 RepID=A0AAF5DLW5_STRER